MVLLLMMLLVGALGGLVMHKLIMILEGLNELYEYMKEMLDEDPADIDEEDIK